MRGSVLGLARGGTQEQSSARMKATTPTPAGSSQEARRPWYVKQVPWIVLGSLAFLAGCVWVTGHGAYHRNDTITQEGSNKVQKIELKPQ